MRNLRPYETLVIIDPRPTDEEVAQLLGRLQDNLKELGAEVTRMESWGKRRLAHDIKKQREGTYAVFEVSAEPSMVKEFERQLRLDRKSTRLNSSHIQKSRMPSSA